MPSVWHQPPQSIWIDLRDYRPDGTGEGISLAEPCVFVAFLCGVVLTAPVVPVVGVVAVEPVCWQDARNAMPTRIAIRESKRFFIRHTSRGAPSLVALNLMNC